MHKHDEAQIRQFASDASAASRKDGVSIDRYETMMLVLAMCTEIIARRVLGIDTSKYVKPIK